MLATYVLDVGKKDDCIARGIHVFGVHEMSCSEKRDEKRHGRSNLIVDGLVALPDIRTLWGIVMSQ